MSEQSLLQTPSQTVGPYFAYGLTAQQYNYDHSQIADNNLVKDRMISGERIIIRGRVFDGTGNCIPDAMLELWQADADGKYNGQAAFKGFGRQGTGTDKDCFFSFETIKPGSVEGAAPHITMIVFMRGLLSHAYTRIYFSDESSANQTDEVLNSVPAERRSTLIAKRTDDGGYAVYLFDIYMQGDDETVFFEV